jgi:uncharacterized protein
MLNRFCYYQLKTSDPEGARAFYADLLGDGFWRSGIDVVSLPASLAARGVPAHWLGHIGVEDVVPLMYRFLEAGATRLGAPPADGRDTAGVTLRDPFGATVALTPASATRTDDRVAWHLLTARDEEQAIELYASVLGWTPLERQDLGERGRHVTFAWDARGQPVGSTSDIGRRPHVHAQWLFFFATPDLDASIARVRELGGLALRPEATADRHRVVACDDPQGAAFGLSQAP